VLFALAGLANDGGRGDVLWKPGGAGAEPQRPEGSASAE
jgi:hypothetical protein